MKMEATKYGALTSNKKLQAAWIKCSENMAQEVIQAWIERIPKHIQEVISQKGNNLYKEGHKKGQEKRRIH